MTKLSVNINKPALIRNSRGDNFPDLSKIALDCERFGAEGITVHPRPDQRHVRYNDIPSLKRVVHTEFNIEGNPIPAFKQLVLAHKPHQVTLVPDAEDVLTSHGGWDTVENASFLKEIIHDFKQNGIRVSLFVNADTKMVEGAHNVGADRIELYTGDYSRGYSVDREEAIKAHIEAATLAQYLGLGINAGHDLNLHNLKYYKDNLPHLDEVSIGHALFVDAIYCGLENVIGMYKQLLR